MRRPKANLPTPPAFAADVYAQERAKYKAGLSMAPNALGGPKGQLGNSHMYQANPLTTLGERYGNFDTLFYHLVSGVVEDPDYALKKDSKVYARMQRDPQIYYCLEVRKKATSSLQWAIAPPEGYTKDAGAMKLAAEATKRIKQIPRFVELLNNILSALLPGISINELVWKLNDKRQYVVKNHFPMSKDRFVFDREGTLRLKQPLSPITGVQVPDYKFLTHTFNITDGSWRNPQDAGYVYFGQGLADTPLYHYFYFKVTAIRFLLKGLERHGHPFKVFYTGGGNPALLERMNTIMLALQNDAVVAIPGRYKDVMVDVPMSRGKTEANLFMGFIDYIDKLITRAVLLQDLMTEMPASGGSYALGQVHESVFAKVAETDKQLLEDTLNNTLMKFDAILNTPGVPTEMWPRFMFRRGTVADPTGFLSTVSSAIELGIDVSEEQLREATGLKKPIDDEDTVSLVKVAELKAQVAPPSFEQPNAGIDQTSGLTNNKANSGEALEQPKQPKVNKIDKPNKPNKPKWAKKAKMPNQARVLKGASK